MQYLPLQHLLDVMYYEKNICNNILKWFVGKKDKSHTFVNMKAKGFREHLWLRPVDNNSNRIFMPDASYRTNFLRI